MEKNSIIIMAVVAALVFSSAGLVMMVDDGGSDTEDLFVHEGKYVNPNDYTVDNLMISASDIGEGWVFFDQFGDEMHGDFFFEKEEVGSIRISISLMPSIEEAKSTYLEGLNTVEANYPGFELLKKCEESFKFFDDSQMDSWVYAYRDLNVLVVIYLDVADDEVDDVAQIIMAALEKTVHDAASEYSGDPSGSTEPSGPSEPLQ